MFQRLPTSMSKGSLISNVQNALRFKSTLTQKPVAVAFDVDGVLLRGSTCLPNAKKALETLDLNNIPFILLTNGGGYTETAKAAAISRILDYEIKPSQLQVCHTPFKELASLYANEPVLLVGKKQIHKIAHEYEFNNTYDIGDLHHQYPLLFPDWTPMEKKLEFDLSTHRDVHAPRPLTAPIKTVLVMLDPMHYHRDAQIIVDVLRSTGTPGEAPEPGTQPVSLHVAGPDLEYVTEWKVPRFGAGIFPTFVAQLFQASVGYPVQMQLYGKPYPATYKYAEKVLDTVVNNNSNNAGSTSGVDVWMVGDNPVSDIRGARMAGWRTVLVRTGMFNGADNDATDPAEYVVDDVLKAVELIVENVKLTRSKSDMKEATL